METKNRLLYIDNIRLFIITLVVIMHISVTYSGMGSWYYIESRPLGPAETTFFNFFETFLQSFFMGLLFLIAGFFVPGAYDRKGFGKFIKDRAVRLGIPALIFMFLIDPLTVYMLGGSGKDFFSFYLKNIISGRILSGTGPLWFAVALLIFSVIYALVRLVSGSKHTLSNKTIKPGIKHIGILAIIITVLAFSIRIWFPIGTSVFNMALCYFAQYIVLFIAGILSYRYDLFSKLSFRAGIWMLCLSSVWCFGFWFPVMDICRTYWGGNFALFNGGFTLQSALFSVWESVTAVIMDFGLLVLFRDAFKTQNKFIRAQSESSFAVYVFHAPILVVAALLFQSVQWSPVVKFAFMTAVCVPLCFAVSYAVRKIPRLKKVL